MIKLTNYLLKERILADENEITRLICDQAKGFAYRSDIENEIFENDISDSWLESVKSIYDVSDFDDTDLIEWIRDIQNETISNISTVSVSLSQYINDKFNGSQTAFAAHNGVLKQQVTKWLNAEMIVVDGVLYSERRKLS